MQEMPDAPFTESDIVFSFAKKTDMASRALELCAQYCPDKKLNESQLRQLGESIAANALTGRGKSAVLVRINSKISKQDFRMVIIHELMHIFCGKLEMNGGHFIDIYGSGTTPDTDPEDKAYDGIIVAGYEVWSEFIAQYYAIKLASKGKLEYGEIVRSVTQLFHEISINDIEGSKKAFSMICAYWFNCTDFEETLTALNEPGAFMPTEEPHGAETQAALFGCIDYLNKQMQKEKPWEINEEFIYDLGFKFSIFRIRNSQYLEVI